MQRTRHTGHWPPSTPARCVSPRSCADNAWCQHVKMWQALALTSKGHMTLLMDCGRCAGLGFRLGALSHHRHAVRNPSDTLHRRIATAGSYQLYWVQAESSPLAATGDRGCTRCRTNEPWCMHSWHRHPKAATQSGSSTAFFCTAQSGSQTKAAAQIEAHPDFHTTCLT